MMKLVMDHMPLIMAGIVGMVLEYGLSKVMGSPVANVRTAVGAVLDKVSSLVKPSA